MKKEKERPAKRAKGGTQGKERQKNRRKDERVTAPLISWKAGLVIFFIMYLLILAQSFIMANLLERGIPTLIGVLVYYLACTGVLLTVLSGLFWRYAIGRPIRKIAGAARKVAGGDFDVQVEGGRRDGRRNEIDVLVEDFNKMARELAGNEMLKNDFISNVSHEMKAPLAVIQSYAKALKDGCVPQPQQEEYAATILAASQNLNAMVGNVLKLSKLENQQIFPAAQTYQLGEQLRRCALSFLEQWQQKDIEFEIGVADVAVCYDLSLLELVWNNLFSNTVKFTPEGGRVSCSSCQKDGCVLVTVQNTGCGIRPEAQSRIFEKFYQGDPSHAAQGNGLGLALVKRVLEIVGGEIAVKSEPGQGAAFTVKLKL